MKKFEVSVCKIVEALFPTKDELPDDCFLLVINTLEKPIKNEDYVEMLKEHPNVAIVVIKKHDTEDNLHNACYVYQQNGGWGINLNISSNGATKAIRYFTTEDGEPDHFYLAKERPETINTTELPVAIGKISRFYVDGDYVHKFEKILVEQLLNSTKTFEEITQQELTETKAVSVNCYRFTFGDDNNE